MSEQRAMLLRKGFIGTGAFAALVLLASFYAIVNGAVERAARQHLAVSGEVIAATPFHAAPRHGQPANALLARVGR